MPNKLLSYSYLPFRRKLTIRLKGGIIIKLTYYASWNICMQVKKQQLELDMEQKTGSKLGKDYVKAIYHHPGYLTYMQSNHEKCWAEWSTS